MKFASAYSAAAFVSLTAKEEALVIKIQALVTEQYAAEVIEKYIDGVYDGFTYGFAEEFFGCEYEQLTKAESKTQGALLMKFYKAEELPADWFETM